MTQVLGLSRYYPTTYRILFALAPVLCMLSTNHHFPDPNLIYTPLRKESTDVSNTIHFTQNPKSPTYWADDSVGKACGIQK